MLKKASTLLIVAEKKTELFTDRQTSNVGVKILILESYLDQK